MFFVSPLKALLSQRGLRPQINPVPSIAKITHKIPRRPAIASQVISQPCPNPAAPAPSTPSRYRTTARQRQQRTVSRLCAYLFCVCGSFVFQRLPTLPASWCADCRRKAAWHVSGHHSCMTGGEQSRLPVLEGQLPSLCVGLIKQPLAATRALGTQ